MKTTAKIMSLIGLVGTILPSLMYMNGSISLTAMKGTMLAASVIWFVGCPFWMDHKVH